MGNRAGHHSDGTEDTLEGMTDITVREVLPWAVDQAPCITFAQVRALAMHQGLTLRDLVAQFQEEVEQPREVSTMLEKGPLAMLEKSPPLVIMRWGNRAFSATRLSVFPVADRTLP